MNNGTIIIATPLLRVGSEIALSIGGQKFILEVVQIIEEPIVGPRYFVCDDNGDSQYDADSLEDAQHFMWMHPGLHIEKRDQCRKYI